LGTRSVRLPVICLTENIRTTPMRNAT